MVQIRSFTALQLVLQRLRYSLFAIQWIAYPGFVQPAPDRFRRHPPDGRLEAQISTFSKISNPVIQNSYSNSTIDQSETFVTAGYVYNRPLTKANGFKTTN